MIVDLLHIPLEKLESLPVTVVAGWVRSKRSAKRCSFMSLSDGSCHRTLQCVIDAEPKWDAILEKIHSGTAITVTGKLVPSPARGQTLELIVKDLVIVGEVGEDYPLQKKSHSLEFLREIAHLRPRTQTFSAIFRLRHALSLATHEFFSQEGFFYVHTPLMTQSDGEGAGDIFQVTSLDLEDHKVDYSEDFFHTKAYLNVTGQLEAEFLAHGLGKVYTFGPTFRAENSNTRHHLAEFWMIEPEMAFADLRDCIDLAHKHFTYLIRYGLEKFPDEMDFFIHSHKHTTLEALHGFATQDAPTTITYKEALKLLKTHAARFSVPVPVFGEDLSKEHEVFLAETYFKAPVFVTDYPKDIKAFYMRSNDDGETVACMDFFVPRGGELMGGSQREERYDYLKVAMDKLSLGEDLSWYLDLRRHGSVPHSGYGMGLERMLMYLTGIENIRDTIPAPRTPGGIRF
ncbi:MAG: asparagine--tRNA ligase [Proteobacteria bacterium]|nr:asparagine--tRNA ligase [Pseudomonadota bacterium]